MSEIDDTARMTWLDFRARARLHPTASYRYSSGDPYCVFESGQIQIVAPTMRDAIDQAMREQAEEGS